MILLQLFWSFLQIGAFSFGGGYAAVPLIQSQFYTSNTAAWICCRGCWPLCVRRWWP